MCETKDDEQEQGRKNEILAKLGATDIAVPSLCKNLVTKPSLL